MKKTVSVVTVPLSKKGWNEGDLINNGSLGGSLASYNNKEGIDDWKSVQLLVLSDDEITENDMVFYSHFGDNITIKANKEDLNILNKDDFYKKIIASYPQLEGTLPIYKETVEQWINKGRPDSATIEMETQTFPEENNQVVTFEKLDNNGNLLIEFESFIDLDYPEEYELTQDEAKEWCDAINKETVENAANKWINSFYQKEKEYNKVGRNKCSPRLGFITGAEWQKEQSKPSIPTDYEILKKSLEHSSNLYNADDKSKDYALSENQLWENSLRDYEAGYKQALKDLGYIK
jgi:hypothetical protein